MISEARSLFLIKRACTVAPQVEKAWPRPIAKALPARVPRIGAHKASFPRPITCGAGFSLWRCRVERAVRSHSLRAWAIGRAQMAIPSTECTLLHTIYNNSRSRPNRDSRFPDSRPKMPNRNRGRNPENFPDPGQIGIQIRENLIFLQRPEP